MNMFGMLGVRLIFRSGQKNIMVGLFRRAVVGESRYLGK